ncbi:tryptophan synthase subunit alpha [Bogoriella caseilytica]|uniref:Tryptophan synthase alpha chain n=1 Tax=Bogoriella caseilytica TaxID=56055 RepID=A0A3N2B8Y1_9MICO|nr:tryptophan synthase subunit alpha [Bogoriella caseilytica]ROR71668.1 tryptophan synthase alpha chain [Bogoriella caseilytica]
MSRSAAAIEARAGDGTAALVGYLPVGFPDVETSVRAARTLVDAGADVIELGLPYSDPGMDGEVIQHAVQTALDTGTRTADVLRAVEQVAETGAAVLVMTYFNPVHRYGVDRFARDLAAAGGAGLITPDLIPDEAGEWISAAEEHDLDRVFLVAPSSTDERLAMTARACRGFVYAASTMGVTGARASVDGAAQELVARTRAADDRHHVCVGLGVSTGGQAAEIAGYADGVIVGSAFVRALAGAAGDTEAGLRELHSLAAEIAAGAHSGGTEGEAR